MKFFIATKEIQSPIVEGVCGVVENEQLKVMHSVNDDDIDQFVRECAEAGIEQHNISAYAALHMISY